MSTSETTGNSLLATVREAARPTEKDPQMNYAELTAESLRQNRPDLVTAIESGRNITAELDAARAEGAKAEGARIGGIMAKAKLAPGHDAVVAEMIADGRTTPDQAASRLLEASAALGGKVLQGLKDADKVVHVPGAPQVTGAGDHAAPKFEQTEAGWKAEFAATPALQTEFVNAEDYVAIRKAEAAGRVKTFGKAA